MTRPHKILGFLSVFLLGVYGCAKGPVTQAPAGPDAAAQARVQKLEDDYKAAAAARDQFRQKLLASEDNGAKLRQEIERITANAARERDALTAQLKGRTLERDNLQVQYDGFRKNIKELIGQAETALATGGHGDLAKSQSEPAGPPRN